MLEEVEGLVRCVSFLVEGATSCLCLVVLIDGSEIDIGVGSLKLRDLAVKSFFFKTSTHFTKVLVLMVHKLVVFDDGLCEAAPLLKALPARQLVVHLLFKDTEFLP